MVWLCVYCRIKHIKLLMAIISHEESGIGRTQREGLQFFILSVSTLRFYDKHVLPTDCTLFYDESKTCISHLLLHRKLPQTEQL